MKCFKEKLQGLHEQAYIGPYHSREDKMYSAYKFKVFLSHAVKSNDHISNNENR